MAEVSEQQLDGEHGVAATCYSRRRSVCGRPVQRASQPELCWQAALGFNGYITAQHCAAMIPAPVLARDVPILSRQLWHRSVGTPAFCFCFDRATTTTRQLDSRTWHLVQLLPLFTFLQGPCCRRIVLLDTVKSASHVPPLLSALPTSSPWQETAVSSPA